MKKSIHSKNFYGFINTKYVKENLMKDIDAFSISYPRNDKLVLPLFPERLMLGKRAERYFSALIDASDHYDMVIENVQVFNQNRTIGEFDFIVRRRSDNQLIHVELVYKFYLYVSHSDRDELAEWVGPNRSDSLRLKVDKLAAKQFPLLSTPDGKSRLNEYNLSSSEIVQQLAFYANLFLPMNDQECTHTMNQDAIEGCWGRIEDVKSVHSDEDRYFVPDKFDWFIRSVPDVDWYSIEIALDLLTFQLKNSRSPMLWKISQDEKFERLFIVCW